MYLLVMQGMLPRATASIIDNNIINPFTNSLMELLTALTMPKK
jgi:hypothetical protein